MRGPPSKPTDRLDSGEELTTDEREILLERVRRSEQGAAEQVEKLRTQLARAEDLAAALPSLHSPPLYAPQEPAAGENSGRTKPRWGAPGEKRQCKLAARRKSRKR